MNNYSSEYSTALAIVGMAGRFPEASSLEHFWQNIAGKVSSIRHYSEEELLAAGVKPEDLQQPNYVKVGAILENIEYFDTSFFGFSPREAELMDPQFRVFLECVWEVLEVAGYDLTAYKGLIGVFAGAGYKNYQLHHINKTPTIKEEVSEFQLSLGQEADVLATMISYKLNLKGPSVSVQSFCSTSLVAVHLACQSLLNYECDMAIAGGIALNSLVKKGYFYEEGRIVSPDGFCSPFDARTQGSVLSNGAAVVAVKRLQDAIKDGDQIYSIIRGSAMNNDGNQRVSYTAPGLDGQATVIASALSYAGVHPETISYIEANGTGTRLGDAIELAALIKAFSSKTRKERFCAISSLKPNIGHLDRASGVAGLIKTTFALSHHQLPPQMDYEQPSPEVDLRHTPFYINTKLAPWPRQKTPRRAGINSFGLGGTNVHLVIEEAPERTSGPSARNWQILPLSAKSAWSLQQAKSNLVAHLKAHPELSLADIAYTLQVGRSAFNYRDVIIAQTVEKACMELEQVSERSRYQEHRDRAVAFLFPAQGQHFLALARNLYRQEPHFREIVLACCQFLQSHLQMDLLPLFVSEEATASESARPPFAEPEQMQLTTFIIEYALAQLLIHWQLRPQAVAGDGTGALVAACIAGVFSYNDALTMLARSAQLLTQQDDTDQALSKLLRTVTWQKPQIPCVSSQTGKWLTKEQASDPDYWARQLRQPRTTRPADKQQLQENGRVVLTIGTDETSRLDELTLSSRRYDQADLLETVGDLWQAGVFITWQSLFAGEQRLRVALPTYAFERHRCWIDDPELIAELNQKKKLEDIAEWFYLPYWEPSIPPTPPQQQPHQRLGNIVLIFADPANIGVHVAQRLQQEGYPIIIVEPGDTFVQHDDQHFSLRPEKSADYMTLFDTLHTNGQVPKTILHCWNVTTSTNTVVRPTYLDPQQQRGFASLLCLTRAIGLTWPEAKIQLTILSNQTQSVTSEEYLSPEKAPILGLGKVIAQEYPKLTCQAIDISDLNTTNWGGKRLIEALSAECLTAPTDLVVAYRGYTRWVQRFSPLHLEQRTSNTIPFRTGGIYLIIGGLGEVGLILAEHLAAQAQARIVLLDEATFPPAEQWASWLESHPRDDQGSQTIQRLEALEAQGAEIQVLQADLISTEQMQHCIAQVQERFGSLHGVFHLAGGSDLQAIQDMEQREYNRYFQPKLLSLYALEQAVQELPLDFCLVFSSLTAILGGVGCAIDAAIGVYTDTFVLAKNQRSATPWISVNWDLWQTDENEQKFLGTTVARYMMSPAEGVEALSRVIASGWIRAINSTGNLFSRLKLLEQASTESPIHQRPSVAGRPRVSTDYAPPTSPVEQKIVEVWQHLLGFEQIGIHDNFFELHGHSLLGMQLIARLRQIFQVNIALAKLFEGPTVAQLAEVIEGLLIEEIEKLEEGEAQLLI